MTHDRPNPPEVPYPSFDPHDPDLGTSYRKDVVRDVTDFRPAAGTRSPDQDRISRLENRVTALEQENLQLRLDLLRPVYPSYPPFPTWPNSPWWGIYY